jgi:hypothetical protein
MRWKMTGQRPVAAALVAILGLAVTRTQAVVPGKDVPGSDPTSNRLLDGDFGLTTQESCARTPLQASKAPEFDPATGRLLVAADVDDFLGSGMMNFKPDGKVSFNVIGAELQTGQIATGDIPVTTNGGYACDGTYTVQSGGQIAVSLPLCNVASTQPGITVTVGPINLQGFVARDRATIYLSKIKASIETIAISTKGAVVQQRQRMCVGNFVLSEIHSSPSK